MSRLLSAQELSDILHADLIRVVREAVQRDRLVRNGGVSNEDAAWDLGLDVEDFFGKASSKVHTALVLKHPSL